MKYIFIFFLGFFLNAQELPVVYVDENFQKIQKQFYLNKKKSNTFLEAVIISDTAVYKKLFYKQFFGILEQDKKSQLNKLLFQKYGVDSTKVWVIHYRDSLPDVTTLPKRNKIIYKPVDSTKESKEAAAYLNSNRKVRFSSFSSLSKHREKFKFVTHTHHHSYNDWYHKTRKEIKKYRKLDHASLLHFYGYNAGFPKTDGDVKWFEDPYKIFKKIFSDGIISYDTIILYPEGDFFVSYYSMSFDKVKKLTYKGSYDKEKKIKGF